MARALKLKEICRRDSISKFLANLESSDGSISPLISGLFLILLILSAGLINVADSSIAKRELIQIVEPMVQSAVQNINPLRYYASKNSFDFLFNRHDLERVPINCDIAVERAKENISRSFLRKKPIVIENILCSEDEMLIIVNSKIHPIINFPIFAGLLKSKGPLKEDIPITARIGATSIYR